MDKKVFSQLLKQFEAIGHPNTKIMEHQINHLASEWKNDMEKRKFTRFRPQEGAYAALRGDFTKVGKIYDISLNGLAFRYLAGKESDEKFTRVDIFMSNSGFHLSGVSCAAIYDTKESVNNLHSVSPYRCGLKFEGIDVEQQNKLEFFLNNYMTGRV